MSFSQRLYPLKFVCKANLALKYLVTGEMSDQMMLRTRGRKWGGENTKLPCFNKIGQQYEKIKSNFTISGHFVLFFFSFLSQQIRKW